MIILAAIRKEGVVYVGSKNQRHNNILCDKSRPFAFLKTGEQGFVDENGKFYNRLAAAIHAFECGQLKKKECPKTLFSEDLW